MEEPGPNREAQIPLVVLCRDPHAEPPSSSSSDASPVHRSAHKCHSAKLVLTAFSVLGRYFEEGYALGDVEKEPSEGHRTERGRWEDGP